MGNRRRSIWRHRDGRLKPPAYGAIVAAVVLVLGVVGVSVAALSNPGSSAAEERAASYTPKPMPSMPEARVERIAFIGDSYTGGSGEDSGPEYLWPQLLQVPDVVLDKTVLARGGSGFTGGGPNGGPLTDLAASVPSDTEIVIIFGSVNDQKAGYDAVFAADQAMYAAVQAAAPSARIIVVSPPWVAGSDQMPPKQIENRDATRDAATAAGLTYVDGSAWFDGTQGLVGADGFHPNNDGHQLLAQKMLDEVLAPALS